MLNNEIFYLFILGEDVPRRAGIWNAVKRMVGVNPPSVLEILITPAILPPSFLSLASSSMLSKNIPQPEPVSIDVNKTSIIPNPLLLKTNKLTTLLPPNIVLPSSALSIVGIYRIMLLKSYQISMENSDRNLPQTGSLHSSSALLSGFPRLIGKIEKQTNLFHEWIKLISHKKSISILH